MLVIFQIRKGQGTRSAWGSHGDYPTMLFHSDISPFLTPLTYALLSSYFDCLNDIVFKIKIQSIIFCEFSNLIFFIEVVHVLTVVSLAHNQN